MKFFGPEPSLGVSRQNIRKKFHLWVDNHHLSIWCDPCSTQRQVLELISDPSRATKVQLLSFSRTQSRSATGLLTGHNTLRRHLCVKGLNNNPTCRNSGTEEETSVQVLCKREALTSLRHAYLGSFFLDHEDDTNLRIMVKEQGFFNVVSEYGTKGPVLWPRFIRPSRVRTQILLSSIRPKTLLLF